ncbi:unnamed protein product [Staurois parvus]|uniref:H15 domain-containing protein n=1 Tax=Staurois parvus TaxID=386267 RepID=A0ABN9HL75_9NEOB|nr:unnamed protein product [Staurois parvus]
MTETESAPAAAPPAEAAAKKKPAKKKASGPAVSELLVQAVSASKERSGVSLAALKKVLSAGGYDVDKNKSRLKIALKALVTKGSLVQVKGHGASGSFKINKKQPDGAKAKPKKPATKKAAKSPKKKKPAAKSPKKKAASKAPTAAKSPKKKPAAKRPAKAAAAAKKVTKSPKKSKAAAKPKKGAKSPAKAKPAAKKAAKAQEGRSEEEIMGGDLLHLHPPKALLRAPHLPPTELSIHTYTDHEPHSPSSSLHPPHIVHLYLIVHPMIPPILQMITGWPKERSLPIHVTGPNYIFYRKPAGAAHGEQKEESSRVCPCVPPRQRDVICDDADVVSEAVIEDMTDPPVTSPCGRGPFGWISLYVSHSRTSYESIKNE